MANGNVAHLNGQIFIAGDHFTELICGKNNRMKRIVEVWFSQLNGKGCHLSGEKIQIGERFKIGIIGKREENREVLISEIYFGQLQDGISSTLTVRAIKEMHATHKRNGGSKKSKGEATQRRRSHRKPAVSVSTA